MGWELVFLWCSLLSFIQLGSRWSAFPLLELCTDCWGKRCRAWERWNKRETTRCEIWTFVCCICSFAETYLEHWSCCAVEVLYPHQRCQSFNCYAFFTGLSVFPFSTLTDVRDWFWATSLVLAYLWSSKVSFSRWKWQPASTSHKPFLLLIGSNCIDGDTCQGVWVLLKVKPAGSYLHRVIVPWVSENRKKRMEALKSHAL